MVIITSHEFGRSVIIKATLSHPLIVATAAAFIDQQDSPYGQTLKAIFGDYSYPCFCFDIVNTNACITFGTTAKAPALLRNKVPVQVDPEYAAPFRLFLAESVAIRTGRLIAPVDVAPYSLRPYDVIDSI